MHSRGTSRIKEIRQSWTEKEQLEAKEAISSDRQKSNWHLSPILEDKQSLYAPGKVSREGGKVGTKALW